MSGRVAIAGGGLAAQRCCERLRALGHDGPITMVCAEPHPPYDRPPLSKGYLTGVSAPAPALYRDDDWYRDNEVELMLGVRATGLDPHKRRLVLGSGDSLPYDRLLIATGARPRMLAAAGSFENVHTLRSLDDAERLRRALRPGVRLAVIGAGFIGQEVAASARRIGAEVAMVECAPAPLATLLGPELGSWFAALHAEEGVELRMGANVTAFRGNGRVEELVFESGKALECDELVVGIGIEPDAGWLRGTPLGEDGVLVNEDGSTVLPGVFAAGDVAYRIDAEGRRLRSEHWEAAAALGAAAARAMLGLAPRAAQPGSFWSDLYGVRIHQLGDPTGADRVELSGDPDARDFTALFMRGDRPLSGLLVGRPRDLPALRRQLASTTEGESDELQTIDR